MPTPQEIEQAIAKVRDQASFIQDLLIDTLGWSLDEQAQSVPDITYEWTADELRAGDLSGQIVGNRVYQIQPPAGASMPWGVFIIEFTSPDAFTTGRGMTGPLRRILRGLVPKARGRPSHLPAWGREHLLFICTHDYKHYRFAYFKVPPEGAKTAPLAAFGWGPDVPARTVCEFNLPELEWPDAETSPEDWVSQWSAAFDVEKVTKRFYEDYRRVFEQVEDLIDKQGDHDLDTPEDLRMFTQTLFNRLMFLRFVERKGWLIFQGHKDYLRRLWEAGGIGRKSLYLSRIRPLFFLGLAVEGNPAGDAIGNVPFLNGGLFEEVKLDKKVKDIPDEVFDRIIGSGGLFYRYNFTVEESTPLDIEVAVDPEMLGKVFEELVTGRHETGSYYTPRQVVSFMCREALKGCLGSETKATPKSIAALVDEHKVEGITESQARQIIDALDNLKAVDPACGSGAYLLGLLHEMVTIYRLLYSEKLVKDARSLFELKLRIISHNLYGVDIDPFATSIAMLRLWLSLIVEYDGPQPPALPNLDFKIETGDSLLGPDPHEMPDLFREQMRMQADVLVGLKDTYLTAHGEVKQRCRETILREEGAIAERLHEHLGPGVIDWRIHFAEVFVKSGGFNIVLANPPYIDSHTMVKTCPAFRDRITAAYETAKGTWDLFVPFWERSIQLLAPGGLATLITPNKWLSIGYGKALRSKIRGHLFQVVDYTSFRAFEQVGVASIVATVRHQSCSSITVKHFTEGHLLLRDYSLPEELTQRFEKWGLLLSPHVELIARLASKFVRLAEVCSVEEAFSVDQAYRLRPLLHEQSHRRRPHFRFLNTGTIDPYVSLWGLKPTTYLKTRYTKPVLDKAEFRDLFPRRLEQMSSSKIIISGMRHFEAFLDSEGEYVAGISTVILRDVRPPLSLLSLVGILNTRLVAFFLKECFGSLGIDSGINYSKLNVSEIPVPSLDAVSRKNIEALVGHVISAKRPNCEGDIHESVNALNHLIYRIYGLSPREIEIVEALAPHGPKRRRAH